MMPTWLSRQDFAKFTLNRHYSIREDMKKITRECVEVFVNASKTVNEDLEVTDSQTESGCCTLVVRITDSCLAFHEFGTGTTENQPCKSAVAR
ncbi:hypothetical protein TNCV_1286221 [Trichonephila clavipes]|uniref:Uncharacterized protein n=1 Tax=Trichonephila clavipes TaxID=2585209 RepID=A0A8X6SLJ0_TRICX|nr:hypothetical protein TNCV_1286221 [Trichonephila clavipes]